MCEPTTEITTRAVLSTPEAAEYLNIPQGTLEVWRSRGREGGPPFVRLGRCVRYRIASLDAYLLESEQGGAAVAR